MWVWGLVKFENKYYDYAALVVEKTAEDGFCDDVNVYFVRDGADRVLDYENGLIDPHSRDAFAFANAEIRERIQADVKKTIASGIDETMKRAFKRRAHLAVQIRSTKSRIDAEMCQIKRIVNEGDTDHVVFALPAELETLKKESAFLDTLMNADKMLASICYIA